MSTFFNTCKRNFKDVPVIDGKINTTEFLEAAESVVMLFGPSSSSSSPQFKHTAYTSTQLTRSME